MGSPAYNPVDNKYYNAESAEDAFYISRGRLDLVPGTYVVKPALPPAPQTERGFSGTRAPDGHYYTAESAEDAFYISRGRTDLVPGCRMR
ncbi:MAG: hypothetical protein JSS83_25680 [Cyanobacteria bacterium SZAS LIN-3]|nr:hypothetical protein [Cyanobacteria bacterium SZAS LIN-3]